MKKLSTGDDSTDNDLIEKLATFKHERWRWWMQYLFTKGEFVKTNGEPAFVIEEESVKRWQRQMMTDYENLPEEEKESDRIEGRKKHITCSDCLSKRGKE